MYCTRIAYVLYHDISHRFRVEPVGAVHNIVEYRLAHIVALRTFCGVV